MSTAIYQVDSFTDTPFHGNPAAVCILGEPATEEWMQQVASEMNLSETAFLHKEGEGFHLRWFTPAIEVELCGHATLASAHILWQTGLLQLNEKAIFYTQSGVLTAKLAEDWIEMDFPAGHVEPLEESDELQDALGIQAQYTGKGSADYLVELESAAVVRALDPDFRRLKSCGLRGVIVTSSSDDASYDFISRFFAPGAGIDEDPVTGSAHCLLGPYWQNRMQKNVFTAYQASKRGGVVKLRVEGDRVILTGQAVTVLKGELY